MDKKIIIVLLSLLGFQSFAQNSLIKLDSILNTIQLLKTSDSVKVKKMTNLAAKYRYSSNTKVLIQAAESISNANSKILLKIDVLRAWGNFYYYNSDFEQSEKYLKKAINLLKQQNNPLLKASIEYALSAVYREKGNIPLAIETLLHSKKNIEQINTKFLSLSKQKLLTTRQIILFNSLANFYNQIGEYDEAVIYYDNAFDKAIQIEPKSNAGTILSNKGNLLINIGLYDEALQVLNKAKQVKAEGGASENSIANTNVEIAKALYEKQRYKEALNEINEVISVYKKYKNTKGLQSALTSRGTIFIALQKYQKAIDDCEKSKQLALKTKVLKEKEEACECLAKAYEKTKNLKKALLNFKLYKEAEDEAFNEENIKKITQLEAQYTFEKEKQRQQLITDAKERESKTTIKSLIFGVLTLLLIIGLLFRFNQVKKNNNTILKEKNAKISETLAINKVLLKETHHRVKNNLQIISSLLNMQSNFLTDSKSKQVIEDSQNRIKSMSLIHQHLYQGKHLTSVEISSYFKKLLDNLCLSYGIDTKLVKMKINIESMLLDIDTAIPLGLIVNELISNAFKHGINKETGYFSLSFKKTNKSELVLVVKDNGKGMQQENEKTNSYGMKLIHILSKKLRGKIDFSNNNGLEVKLVIKKFKIIT